MTTQNPTQQPTELPPQPWWKKRGILGAIGCGAAAAIALAVALPIAFSGNPDDAYLTELRDQTGFAITGQADQQQAINLGHHTCDLLASNGNPFDAATGSPNPDAVFAVIQSAVDNYCPQYRQEAYGH